MEIAIAVGSLRVAYSLLITGIKVEQVPNAVRRCIELVRTCHRDLDDLIKLRNESLPMLSSKPAILERINVIIQNAHNGLLEVARLVEKLRPEAHDGSSPLMGRLEWLFVDSREFASQEPLISRQHSSVIAELTFLRQLILLAPLIDRAVSGSEKDVSTQKTEKKSMVAWDNVGLLDEMLGGNKRVSGQHNPSTSHASNSIPPPSVANDRPVNPTLVDPPPPYSSPKPISALPSPLPATTTNPLVYNVAVPASGAPLAAGLDTIHLSKSQPSTDLKRRTTTFHVDGMAFLFGDLKLPSKDDTVSSIPATVPLSQPWLSRPQSSLSMVSMWSNLSSEATIPDQRHSTPAYGHPPEPSARPMSQPIIQQVGTQLQPQQQNPYPPQVPPKQQPPQVPPKQHPPQVLPKQQPIPSTKPLSTIPQELIHRHDHLEPQQQPIFSPLPPVMDTPKSTPAIDPSTGAAPPIQHQGWSHNPIPPADQSHTEQTYWSSCKTSNPTHLSPPMNTTSNNASTPQRQPSHWFHQASRQSHPITTVPRSENQNRGTTMAHRHASSSYNTSGQTVDSDPTAAENRYIQSLRSVPTYATLREHWNPEHLTGVQQVIETSTPPVDRSGNIIGGLSGPTPSVSKAPSKSQLVHTEIHELPAGAFEPDAVELP